MPHSLALPLEDEHFYKSNVETKPGKYRHFKGNEYEVLGTALDSENCQEVVLYKALYSEQKLWVRPLHMFCEHVYKNGKFIKRFKYVG